MNKYGRVNKIELFTLRRQYFRYKYDIFATAIKCRENKRHSPNENIVIFKESLHEVDLILIGL